MCYKHTTHKELKMKLEMAVHGLNVNLELEEQKNRLLEYIKNTQRGLHFIGRGEEEPISCNRLAFMAN